MHISIFIFQALKKSENTDFSVFSVELSVFPLSFFSLFLSFGPFFFQIDVALGCDVAAGVLTSLLALKISRLGPLDLGLGCNNVAAGVLTSP